MTKPYGNDVTEVLIHLPVNYTTVKNVYKLYAQIPAQSIEISVPYLIVGQNIRNFIALAFVWAKWFHYFKFMHNWFRNCMTPFTFAFSACFTHVNGNWWWRRYWRWFHFDHTRILLQKLFRSVNLLIQFIFRMFIEYEFLKIELKNIVSKQCIKMLKTNSFSVVVSRYFLRCHSINQKIYDKRRRYGKSKLEKHIL